MLEIAVLGLLKEQPLHGYELKKRLGETLGFLWGVSYGSLYPALQRLENKGWITSAWEVTENNRQARVYSLTRKGRSALGDETASWRRYASAVEFILRTT